jgi:phosphoglycerol geranylgeranyltransferase
VDFFLVGGSLLTNLYLNKVVALIKDHCNIPVILFPGSNMHINAAADALLFLSLISGRNSDLLIGQHVVAAPILKKSRLEILPTGYILIDGGNVSTVSYMSNTTPIPADKYSVATCTALAGEMLGLKLIYLDAGSGALTPISPKMISSVKKAIEVPLIVGGGIDSVEKADKALEAGADLIVIGNAIEKNPDLLIDISIRIGEINEKQFKKRDLYKQKTKLFK